MTKVKCNGAKVGLHTFLGMDTNTTKTDDDATRHAAAVAPFDTLGEVGLAAVIADGDGIVWSIWAHPAGGYVARTDKPDEELIAEAFTEILMAVADIR